MLSSDTAGMRNTSTGGWNKAIIKNETIPLSGPIFDTHTNIQKKKWKIFKNH
jgi:hypothetical protein